ncbi:MAG: DUF1801 domain-containing protein [Phycisphaerales bacterium]|nr:DUF1801 domain-containing protein [Phycisphaerales bacterium]
MQSKAASVAEYLASLPADRRGAIERIRSVILENLDGGFEEGMQYGMIGYYVPHSLYPPGYHCNPAQGLPFAALASQKNYMAVYIMCMYEGSPEGDRFREEWESTGKRLDMGKCCVRFKTLDDVPLEVLGGAFKRVTAKKYIEYYEAALRMNEERKAGAKSGRGGAKKSAKKTSKKAAKQSGTKRAKKAWKRAGKNARGRA